MAWQSISSEVTVKGFKQCCVSGAVDGTDMLWNFRGECEEDEGTNGVDGDSDTDC